MWCSFHQIFQILDLDENEFRKSKCGDFEKLVFGYIGRPERASPGEGYPVTHALEQERIITTALNLRSEVSQYPGTPPGER